MYLFGNQENVRKCKQQVENVFSMVFSRTQPNIRKYFPKYFLKCNQTHENIFLSGKQHFRKISIFWKYFYTNQTQPQYSSSCSVVNNITCQLLLLLHHLENIIKHKDSLWMLSTQNIKDSNHFLLLMGFEMNSLRLKTILDNPPIKHL